MFMIHRKEPIFLLIGDVILLVVSLWLALFLRYFELPTFELYTTHIKPFSVLFVAWLLVFFIMGMYEKHTVLLKSRLPAIVIRSLIINSLIAVVFFYLVSFFSITPKTILVIYLAIFCVFTLLWRTQGHRIFGVRERQNALIIGRGTEMKELFDEVNRNNRYGLTFISSIDLDSMDVVDFKEEILKRIYSEDIEIIAIDLNSKKVESILPALYNLIFSNIRFIDMHKVYEDIFDRVPLSLIQYNWFLENISATPKKVYDSIKRVMDIVASVLTGLISLPIYPFVICAIKLEDRGSIFSFQTRVGKNNKPIKIVKFRTMTLASDDGVWGQQKNEVTKVGKFLRKSRIDELPQVWNVLKGDMSFIGPRPEFFEPVKKYNEQIPYYNIRHIIKPGLSGWAQIYGEHPHHGVDYEKTQNKLSYDLYYIKNRSIILDLKIALRTLHTLITFVGR